MSDPMAIGTSERSAATDRFRGELARRHPGPITRGRVLELGTLQSEPPRSTHHGAWLPAGVQHVKCDVAPGPDVDVVADAHTLLDDLADQGVALQFDAAIAVSVWEHLERPWVCAEQLRCVMRRGAIAYICTHHTFPVHGYPSDFTRWTDDGLAVLFEWAGFEVLERSYAYPARIIPPPEITRWNEAAPAWLNVDVCLRAR